MAPSHMRVAAAEQLAAAVRDARRTARRLRPRRARVAPAERHHAFETRAGA